jgi:ubiquinone/menaquinone biosynthesis C-methylase UbiE
LASPLRRLVQDPHEILGPLVGEGMTVVEPGPGMGFFTLELARLVGTAGRVIAVDVQPKMLEGLRRRARKAGLEERIETREATAERLGADDLRGNVDFLLAFAMVHEMPHVPGFFAESAALLKPGSKLLLAEPTGHVTGEEFEATLRLGASAGLRALERPAIRWSHAAVLARD